MLIRNILVPICPKVEFNRQIDVALSLAQRVEGHVNAVYIRPDPIAVAAALLELSFETGITAEQIDHDSREAEAEAHAKFKAWRKKHGLAGGVVDRSLRSTFACWSERVGSLETIIVQCGRLSDLVILNQPRPDKAATERAFDSAVFETARPTIILPDKLSGDLLRHVIIAWNGSLEAARAVGGAITLLHEAGQVSVFTTPQPADDLLGNLDLLEFLTWHGIEAKQIDSGAEDGLAGTALLRLAKEHDASMIVMGAYTHSRVRELNLGGVTSHVLHHSEIPVLMMH